MNSQDLFSPLKIRGITLKNRIVVSPMCQYSSKDGMADDWHLVHLGSRAAGGAALVFTEAAAVTAQGRISPADLGIWEDRHIDPLKRIVDFIERMNAVAGIQLAHAGRKASHDAPWKGGGLLSPNEEGWEVVGPSVLPFSDDYAIPQELSIDEIKSIVLSFEEAAKRALKAGFKIIEIHAAHGYLLHEFMSPLSNERTDEYGGSFEGRIKLTLEVASQLRALIPEEMPLFVRISATDWVEGGWDLNQSIALAQKLKEVGVDLIDCSSGALVPYAEIPVKPGYQVPFAEAIRKEAGLLTGAVGLITEADQANAIIASGSADLVFLAREFLKEPYWAIKAAEALKKEPTWPVPYGYAFKRKR